MWSISKRYRGTAGRESWNSSSPPGVYPNVRNLLPAAVMLATLLAHAQPIANLGTPSGPKFEVATIKPAPAPSARMGIRLDAARVDIGYWSLKQLILRAYSLQPPQVSGPDFIDSLRFDVLAKLPDGAGPDQLPNMLQWLLAERFGLAAHGENRNLAVFALVPAKGGPGMKRAPSDPFDAQPARNIGPILDSLWSNGPDRPFGLTAFNANGSEIHLEFAKLPMAALAQILASYLRTPVLDSTGLDGPWRVSLDFTLGNSPEADASVFSAVQHLGLRLERRTAATAVLVVDRLDRVPTAN